MSEKKEKPYRLLDTTSHVAWGETSATALKRISKWTVKNHPGCLISGVHVSHEDLTDGYEATVTIEHLGECPEPTIVSAVHHAIEGDS